MVAFAALVPVGPQSADVDRMRDLVSSLVFYEQRLTCLVLVDDAVEDRRLLDELRLPDRCIAFSLQHPCHGSGNAYLGGLAAGILHGLAWIQAHVPVDFVLKIDTDALVIRPFAEHIAAAFLNGDDVGLVGTVGCTCNRRLECYGLDWLRPSPLARALHQARLATSGGVVAGADRPLTPEQLGASQAIWSHVDAAVEHGFFSNHYCQGGAYAVSSRMLQRMAQAEFFDYCLAWASLPFAEDFILGMYSYAVGMSIRDLSMEGQPFGMHWRGLAFTPTALLAKGYAIIHSLKNDVTMSEASIRAFFSSRRSLPVSAPQVRNSNTAHPNGYVFYADADTAALLRSSMGPKTLVVGSYTGIATFANVVQLQSIVRGYQRHSPAHRVIPVVGVPAAAASGLLHSARRTSDTPHVVLVTQAPLPDDMMRLHQIEPVEQVTGLDRLHVYGRSSTRPFADWLLMIDTIIERFQPRHYLLSGQQVGTEDAATLLQHLSKHRPVRLGCRDAASVQALAAAGGEVMQSGDDALDLFLELAEAQQPLDESMYAVRHAFALHLEPLHSMIAPDRTRNPALMAQALLVRYGAAIAQLGARHESYARPLLVSTSAEARWDTWLTLRSTAFWDVFPLATCLDLTGPAARRRLDDAVRVIRGADLHYFVGNCDCTALLFACLGVPSFVLGSGVQSGAMAMGGVGQEWLSFDEFLTRPFAELWETQASYLARESSRRQDWWRALASL